jgi:hypothetical protein
MGKVKYYIPNPIDELKSKIPTNAGLMYGFGISQSIIKIKTESEREKLLNLYQVTSDPDYAPDAMPDGNGGFIKSSFWNGSMSSALSGMPVMCNLEFIGGTYTDLQGKDIEIPDVNFETVILTVVPNKNIAKTSIFGRDKGTVKEYIGMGDYDVEIRAVITADAPVNDTIERKNQDGVYPRDNMAAIVKLIQAPIALPVECWFLRQFNITHLVIEPGTLIQQIPGEYTQQRIIMPCVSDYPLIIKTFE